MTYSIPSPQGFTPISTRYAQSNNFANDFLAGAAFKQQKDALKAQEARLNEFGAGLKGLKQGGDPNELMGRFPDQQKQIIQQLEFNKQQKLKEDYDALDKNDPMALKEFHNKYTDPKDAVGQQIASLKEEHKKSLALQGGQAYMRLLSGDSEGAIGGLKEYGELLKEKDPQMSAFILDNTDKLKNMDADDQAVMLSGVVERLDPEILVRAKERAGIKKTESEAKETDAKTLATQGEESRAQDLSKVEKDLKEAEHQKAAKALGAPTEYAMKRAGEALAEYEPNQNIYTQSSELMDKIDKLELSGGVFQKGQSFAVSLVGAGGDKEVFRQQLTSLINSDIIGKRKPGMGPMSDNDYKVLRAGAPDIDASPEVIKAYLQAVKRYSAFKAQAANLRGKFIARNGYEGEALVTMDIDGHKAEKGQTLNQFLNSVGPSIYENMEKVPTMSQDKSEVPSFLNKYKAK
jgi:hypothetical protein